MSCPLRLRLHSASHCRNQGRPRFIIGCPRRLPRSREPRIASAQAHSTRPISSCLSTSESRMAPSVSEALPCAPADLRFAARGLPGGRQEGLLCADALLRKRHLLFGLGHGRPLRGRRRDRCLVDRSRDQRIVEWAGPQARPVQRDTHPDCVRSFFSCCAPLYRTAIWLRRWNSGGATN